MTLGETIEEVQDHMDVIRSYFKPGVKVTVMVRSENDPEGRRDFMLTDDDPQELISMINRRAAAGAG